MRSLTRTYTIVSKSHNERYIVGRVKGAMLPRIKELEKEFRSEYRISEGQYYLGNNQPIGEMFIQWLITKHNFVMVDTDTVYL